MEYELYYNYGGHGGPYPDYDTAVQTAKNLLNGSKLLHTVEVRPRKALVCGGYGERHYGSTYVARDGDGFSVNYIWQISIINLL